MKSKFLALPNALIGSFFCLFAAVSWFVSDPVRAARIDRYVLYYIDDIFNYCIIRGSVFDPLVFFNSRCKALYILMGRIFFEVIPLGMTSVRLMNSFFSAAILVVLYKLARKLGFKNGPSILAVLFTATFPLYFLASVSALSEILFCFFLVLGLYLFYSEKYISCGIIASLLPLIRLEGFLYLAVYAVFLLKNRKARYVPLVFSPFFLWVLSNLLLIGYLFFIFLMPKGGTMPAGALIPLASLNHFLYVFAHPLIILSVIGIALTLFDLKFRPILFCIFIVYSILFMGFVVALLMTRGASFPHDIKYLVSIAPLLSLYAAFAVEKLSCGFGFTARQILVSAVLVLSLFFVFTVNQLQVIRRVTEVGFDNGEERSMQIACVWFNKYLKNEGRKNVYVAGNQIVNLAMRRLWLGSNLDVKYYAVVGGGPGKPVAGSKYIMDLASYKFARQYDPKGVFVSSCKEDSPEFKGSLPPLKYRLIKEFPAVSLYFYLSE